jgi:glycosyltransferase involved in cell wall biosynthesis
MGAPQNRLFELTKGLIKLGWQVQVVTAMPNYPTGKIFKSHKNKFSQTDWIEGIEVKRFWLFASNSSRIFPRIISMLSFSFTSLFSIFFIRSRRPVYLLVESPPLTLAFSGWLLSVFSKTKLILNISDLWPLSAKELGAIKDGGLYTILVRLETFLYKKASICTGQSQEIVEYIEKTIPGKTYLFRNGVDTSRFEGRKFNPSNRKKLVYAGLLGVAQGILSICKKIDFKSLHAEFHIYGTGAELESIISFQNDNPTRGITYHGILKRDEMPDVLSSYGGALIPLVKNIYGAVPSKIYEAMAAGLPIIFSGEGEGEVIIKKSNAGWVNSPGNWEALQTSITEFLAIDDDDYFAMRENNKKIASVEFDRIQQIAAFNQYLLEHDC